VTGTRAWLPFLYRNGEDADLALPGRAVDRELVAREPVPGHRHNRTRASSSKLRPASGGWAPGLRDLDHLLAARLRAGVVARLALGDIDWRRGELVVHGKGARHDRLPLPTDVGEAIAAWLNKLTPQFGTVGRWPDQRAYPVTDEPAKDQLFSDEGVDSLPRDSGVQGSTVPLTRTSTTARQPPLRHHPDLLGQSDVGDMHVVIVADGEGVDAGILGDVASSRPFASSAEEVLGVELANFEREGQEPSSRSSATSTTQPGGSPCAASPPGSRSPCTATPPT
jgi:hypothetical protein